MTRRKSLVGNTRPLDRRPCDSCGESIFFAFSPVNRWDRRRHARVCYLWRSPVSRALSWLASLVTREVSR